MTKYVYLFKEGNASMRNLLGGKGAGLAEMTRLGLPVPRGFTITTEACNRYYEDNETIAPEIESEVFATLAKMEEITGMKLYCNITVRLKTWRNIDDKVCLPL